MKIKYLFVLSSLALTSSCYSEIRDIQGSQVRHNSNSHMVVAAPPEATPPPHSSSPPLAPTTGGMALLPWKITRFYRLNNAKLSENQARQYLFKEAVIGKNFIQFGTNTCQSVNYVRATIPLSHALEKYQVSSEALDISQQQVTRVTTNCNIEGFDDYIQLRDNRLLVEMKGVLFFFTSGMTY